MSAKSLEGRDAAVTAVSNQVAQLVLALGGRAARRPDGLIDDYRFLCESIVLPEELHFRRQAAIGYRASSMPSGSVTLTPHS